MVLYVYDINLQPLGLIEEIKSFVWIRRYYEPGEMKLLLPYSAANRELLQTGRLIRHFGECAEIEYIKLERDESGQETMEVCGRFLAAWLERRVINPAMERKDTRPGAFVKLLVQKNMTESTEERKVTELTVTADTSTGEQDTYSAERFDNLLDVAEDILEEADMGMRVSSYQYPHELQIYQGTDRTEGNAGACIFSTEFENVLAQEYEEDCKKQRNMAYISGEEKDGKPTITYVGDGSTGLQRREIRVNASARREFEGDGGKTVTLTEAQFLSAIKKEGKQALAQNKKTLAFDSDIATNVWPKYRTDYDLGDKVTIVNRNWNVRTDTRITEIEETYEAGGMQLRLTFGDSIPSLYKSLKNMR